MRAYFSKSGLQHEFREITGSYSILFFSNSRIMGIMLLLVTFFKPIAGISGILALVVARLFIRFSNMPSQPQHNGLFSFNSLMIGLAMGTFFNTGLAFWVLLILLSMVSVIFSGVLWHWLSPKGLPFLAIPFMLCFSLVLLLTREFNSLPLTSRNIYWLNTMYSFGEKTMVDLILRVEYYPLPLFWSTFFKSLSSLFFQNNVLSGAIIFMGILIHSRIMSCLALLGFAMAFVFNREILGETQGLNYYLMGANFIMVTMAMGGFFVIPSRTSYLWSILAVPVTFIISSGLNQIFSLIQLPVYTWPFSIVTLVMLYYLSLVKSSGSLRLTPWQYYSPEKNLYAFLNNRDREIYTKYIPLQLPFMGEWMVSQGYDGEITHKGEWSKALDFVIVDRELKTCSRYSLNPEDYYCFNKPVLAPADGYVTEIIDYVDDNEIGKINQKQNWGNTIILQHSTGLYTKLCHLKKQSFRVRVGDYVRQGDIIAACGNSGRSPEPHLHVQVQSTSFVGSKTMAYPFSFFRAYRYPKLRYPEFEVPAESELVSQVQIQASMKKAFSFVPGYRMKVSAPNYTDSYWEVFTDAFNQNYLYCHHSGAIAYFRHLPHAFYFVSYEGPKDSLLYAFYRAAYKVILSTELSDPIHDTFPLQFARFNPLIWLQDLISPFYIFQRLHYRSWTELVSRGVGEHLQVRSETQTEYLNHKGNILKSSIEIRDSKVHMFTFMSPNKEVKVLCTQSA